MYEGIEYTIEARLSAEDSIYLIDYLNGENEDYNFAVATVVKKHIAAPNQEEIDIKILSSQQYNLQQYINAIIEEEHELRTFYENHAEELDACYRFVLAVKDIWAGMTKEVTQIIPRINIPKIVVPSMKTMEGIASLASSLNQYAIKTSFNLAPAIQQFANTMASLRNFTEPLFKAASNLVGIIANFSAQIKPLFLNIKIPQISEERKEELRLSYEAWGKFGWTTPPMAEITVFNEAPTTIQKANARMMPYTSKSDMVELFKLIDEMPNLSQKEKKDLKEAEFNFEHKNYKSCAMIIFSLLDARLIRMQRKEDINKKTKRRDSGLQAAEHIKTRIENEHDINKRFFMLLSYTNLFACIGEFFAYGNDFKEQPQLVNRNFIDHGMLHKNVRRRDCVQLFLLYYNFIDFFNMLNRK